MNLSVLRRTKMENAGACEELFPRLGDCEVCKSTEARYTCPRCNLKTCCLDCVVIHKQEMNCNGERDKTGYVPLSEFTNLTLLSDYRFLEDVARTVDICKRNPLKKFTRFKRPLPPHLWKLRSTALKRKTTLHFLPQHFTRHKENSTQLNFKTGVIFWKIEFVFPQGGNIRVALDKCSENDRLSLILSSLVDYEMCPDVYKNNLMFYHAAGLSGIEALLKAENVKGSDSFFLLDTSLTLKENLEKRIIIENPIVYVILKDHKDEYTILDSDMELPVTLNEANQNDKKFSLFHYFDAVSYTNEKVSNGEQYVESIHSSVKELEKYFLAGDGDETDEESVPVHSKKKQEPRNDSSDVPNLEQPQEGKKKKQKHQKKLKVKQQKKQKLQVKQQEENRTQVAIARQKYLEETKERVQAKWKLNKEKSLVYREEQERRIRDFGRSFEKISEIEAKWRLFKMEKRRQQEWERYMTCDNLPNPTNIPEMNTYKFVWTERENDSSISYTLQKAEEVIKLLSELEEAISDPWPNCPRKLVNDWKSLRNEMRTLLQEQIDRATYRLFRRIETDMETVDVTTARYYCEKKYFAMRLWAELITPIPSGRAVEARHPMTVSFHPIDFTVVLPVMLLDVHKVIRVLLMNYDHCSDFSRTFESPPVLSYYTKTLLQLALEELQIRSEIVKYRDDLEQLTKKKLGVIPIQPTVSQELFAWEGEPQRVLSEEVAFKEEEKEEEWKDQARMILGDYEVNLRERQFLGRLLMFDIYHQPPQPKYLRFKHDVTLLTDSQVLHPIQYLVTYPPPKVELPPGEEPTEEKLQRIRIENRQLLEKRKNELINVRLKLPNTVYWFETPQIAHWNEAEKYWSSEYIYDKSFDEEEATMIFSVGVLGIFGLHVSRFCNLPYKDWRMEADGSGGVNFYLKTAAITLYFKIQEDEVCLEKVDDLPSKPFQGLLNTYHTPVKLIQMLKSFGINVFPEPDAACYLPYLSPKHIVCERYIYQIWGLFSASFAFKFSKFNRERGRRHIVFQIKEVYDSFKNDFCLIRTSPTDACILDITEENERYSPEPAPGIQQTSTDIYNLIMRNCTNGARRRADTTSFVLIQTIRDLLSYIRPLSFS